MKRSIISLLLAIIVLPAYGQQVRVVSESATSTTIEVVPDSIGADTIRTGNTQALNLMFKGAGPEFNMRGDYLRQFVPVLVGVFSRRIQVQVLQTDYRTLVMMPPVRSPRIPGGVKATEISQFLSYDLPYEQRNHLVSRIKVYPFMYDSTAGTYHILQRIVVQVVSVGMSVRNQSVGPDLLLGESLVNYSQVKSAVMSAPSGLMKVVASSVLSQGTWYKFGVSRSGIYKISYLNLKNAGIAVDKIQLSTIRLFNNGGSVLPEDPTTARPTDLVENAIYVYDANGNDKFDQEDFILFYGKSPREWSYNPGNETYSHYLNPYTETNFYFLTFGGAAGKRMTTVQSVHSTSYYTPLTFTCGIAADSELYNIIGSGKEWYGQELQPPSQSFPNSNVALYVNRLYGLDSTRSVTYHVRVVTRSDNSNHFDVFENSTGFKLGTIYGSTVDYSDIEDNYAYSLGPYRYTSTGNIPSQRSALKFVYYSDSPDATGWIDWFEILYQRKFQSLNDFLDFYGPDTSAVAYYSVSGFSSNNMKLFDVSDYANVKLIAPDSTNGGTISFGSQANSGAPSQFMAVGDNGYQSIGGMTAVDNSNLHGNVSGEDLIIVTAPDFISQADQLASFKQSFDGFKTLIVATTSIYNEFGCGIPDPTAIRDFLEYQYKNDQLTPSYVILFGGGSYDYKSRVSATPEFIPPYESDESLYQVGSYSTDDYFVQFAAPLMYAPISMAVGRLPAKSSDDADAMVSKIIEYESKPDFGSWRSLITYIGDDGITTGGAPIEPVHTDNADLLAQNYTPPEFDKRKIYLALYPTVISTQGRRKPDATADIINQVNQGTLILNFVGHGAFNLWSYTHVLEAPVVVPQLTNFSRLSLFVAATCDFAYDDNPQSPSGAELLMTWPQGGAIGVVSSTRVVYSNENAYLNQQLFTDLLARDSVRNAPRIGEAMYLTKQLRYDSNDIKYQYIGDPTVRLGMPKFLGSMDSLNGKSLVQVSQVRALDKLDIKGTIFHPDMTPWSNLSGTGLVTLYDSDKPEYISEWGETYSFQGSILFRGNVSIQNGTFEARAVVPSDISYSNESGKLEIYFQAGGSDGSGYSRNLIVGGTATNVVNNGIPPQISVYLDSRNFRDGDVVSENPTLLVDLHSSNGINLSDVGVGHTLQAIFDNQQSVDLSSYYIGNLNSYQDGTVSFPVTMSLPFGQHSVNVKAFDVFDNEAQASAEFNIQSSEKLSILDLYNYPDPFRAGTSFTFKRSSAGGAGSPVDVTIKVYTLSGRLIKTIRSYGITDDFVKIDWNGLDEDGDRLANGVYFYKVVVSTVDGAYTSEALGKMAVVR
ncbi:MAG TPA: type IX secretion system sortase PorU [Candidatus Kryptonia bacterium]